ncbi:winged helix-turn-helix transcriptional regulator [Methanocaldococcus sp.]
MLITFLFLGLLLNLSLENITELSYNEKIYLEYVNNTPYFYLNAPKDYYLKPLYIKCEDKSLIPYLKELNFKLSDNGKLIITDRDINVSKGEYAIIILKTKQNKTKDIIWLKNPLNINYSKVISYGYLNKTGEVIAVYKDKKPAIVKVGNKIYVSFYPTNKYQLANIIYVFIIKKTNFDSILFIILFLSLSIIIVLLISKLKEKLISILYKVFSLIIVIGRINVNDEEEVLLNNTRRMIYEHILDNPGIHLRAIAEDLNLSVSTVLWHLRILEKAGLIKKEKLDNKLTFYPTYINKEDMPKFYLRTKIQREIFNYLKNCNGAHLRKIAKDLDKNVETIRYNLKKLEEMGIVKKKEDKNRIVYFLDEGFK